MLDIRVMRPGFSYYNEVYNLFTFKKNSNTLSAH